MTLRQCEAFLAVVKAGSFRRGAELLHISQPSLSQHVRELEEEFGVRLLDRLGRRVALTPAGRVVEEHARRLFATIADARDHVNELMGLQRGSLMIGASTTPGIYVLPKVIATYRSRYPAIQVTLRIANSQLIEERIRAHEFDLGVIGGHMLGPGEDCLAAGLVDELVLVVPPTHRWGRRRHVDLAELADVALLMREEGSATRAVTERALRQHGVRFSVAMELGHVEAIKQAVMAGLGVAFLSTHAIRAEAAAARLHVVRLRGVEVRRHFHVIHGLGRRIPATAQALLDLLTAAPAPQRSRRRTSVETASTTVTLA